MKRLLGHRWFHHLAAPLLVGLLFGLVEVMQNQAQTTPLLGKLVRPLMASAILWLVMLPVTALINSAFTAKLALLPRLILASVLGAMPISVLLPWLILSLGLADGSQIPAWQSADSFYDLLLTRYFQILLIVTLIWCGVNYRWYRDQEATPAPEPTREPRAEEFEANPPAPQPKPPAFLERSRKTLGDQVWLVSAEQHYIRVVTPMGEDLLLYRFSDAVRDLEGHDGLQVHRSHWVSAQALDKAEPQGKSYELTLKDGSVIPVSRSYKQAVEKAGWNKPGS